MDLLNTKKEIPKKDGDRTMSPVFIFSGKRKKACLIKLFGFIVLQRQYVI